MAFLVRILLVVAGSITTVFLAADAPNFGVMQAIIGLGLIAAIVLVLALWRR